MFIKDISNTHISSVACKAALCVAKRQKRKFKWLRMRMEAKLQTHFNPWPAGSGVTLFVVKDGKQGRFRSK